MNKSSFFLAGAFSILNLVAATTMAADAGGPSTPQQITDVAPVTESERLQQIPHTLKALEEAKDGKYGKLNATDAHNLDKADREITLLTGKYDDLNQLNAEEKQRLFNSQETIMAVVSGMQRSRLICKTVRKVGTRLGTRQCMTADMAEAQRRAAKETVDGLNRVCVPGEGNPCSR